MELKCNVVLRKISFIFKNYLLMNEMVFRWLEFCWKYMWVWLEL